MLTLQRFLILFVLSAITLTGCAWSGAEAPETTGTIDTTAVSVSESRDRNMDTAAAGEPASTVHREEAKEAAAPAEVGKTEYAGEADAETAAGGYAPEAEEAPAEEPAAMKSKVEMAIAATPTPMATAGPMLDDDETAMARSAEGESEMAVARQSEPLRAGEVDDNDLWDDYLMYRRNYAGPRVHNRDISERYIIEVTDTQGYPILGADVRILLPDPQRGEIYRTRTFANGQALFHPPALDMPLDQVDQFLVEVENGGVSRQFTLTRFEAQPATSFAERWTVALDTQSQRADSLNLDVLFLVDATGSMADEIEKIQNTIFDVSAQIDALPENPNVRYGLVTYRDREDSYVTRTYNFTPDVRDFSKNLNTVRANGGGDYPESLNEGLHNALHNVEWRGSDSVKLIFLIADAPPHLDYVQDFDYAVEMDFAARRGIKIHPIASSGLDDQGEYIFRQIAQYTQGRFVFLTYESKTNGGAPGDVTTHHVDEQDYSVENLDRLLVRLVEEELAPQNKQLAQHQ